MPLDLRVGLCGFTIGAATYHRRFGVVEVQQTFYDPPANETLDRWRAAAPASFEFTIKAWQVITHLGTSRTYRRLRSPFSEAERAEAGGFRLTPTVLRAWDRTCDAAMRLQATAILFQCPPSFHGTQDNVSAMHRFFEEIAAPPERRFLWEPRGSKWPDDLVREICDRHALVHVVDPFVRQTVTQQAIYWRLHGNGSHYASYTDAELAQLADWLPDDGTAYVMFNNIPRVKDAARFRVLVGDTAHSVLG
jgi:uncharacterized protein YecE (DUF72 family)